MLNEWHSWFSKTKQNRKPSNHVKTIDLKVIYQFLLLKWIPMYKLLTQQKSITPFTSQYAFKTAFQRLGV